MPTRYLRIERMPGGDVCSDLLEYVKNQATYLFNWTPIFIRVEYN